MVLVACECDTGAAIHLNISRDYAHVVNKFSIPCAKLYGALTENLGANKRNTSVKQAD